MTKRGFTSAILGLGLVIGCHHDQGTQTVPAANTTADVGAGANAPGAPPPIDTQNAVGMTSMPETGLACPMEVPGAKVAIAEIKGEAALDFTTNGDVIDLRKRVRAFSDPQNVGMISPDSAGGDSQGSGGREMQGAVTHVTAKATFEDLPNGVRVVFTAVDPGQDDALRSQIVAQVVQLNQGDCSSLEINGVQMKAPNNDEHKADRVPPKTSPESH